MTGGGFGGPGPFGGQPLPPPPPQWGAGPPQPGPFGNQPQFTGQPSGPPGYIPMPTPKPARKPWLRLPSSKRGRRILLGAGAGVVAVALVAAGVVAFSGGTYDEGAGTAGEAVTAYLEALQRGDAKTALSLGREQPPDTTMLTDDILKKQMEKFPITDVKILGDIPTADGGARVHVIAKVGGVDSDESIKLEKPPPGEGWKLKSAAMATEFDTDGTNRELVKSITVWGKPIPKSGKGYYFPGLVELASSNPAVGIFQVIGDEDPSLYEISTMKNTIYPEFEITDQGRQMVMDAMKNALDECAKSTSLQPPNCPNGAARSDFVPDSAKWTAPPDIDGFSVTYMDEKDGTVRVSGRPEFGVSVKTASGQTESGTFTPSVYAKVDVTTDPPTVDFDKS
ncbi:hypothetical protein VST63_10830 [Mycolicibacterium sp. 050232]|uniref:hypothetical protein n=1 Tax=Mycolicibacterium sp. 050232 TaxID=3113982 RepID=UPI002E2B3A96|nr:hypothetical protein [Mycolicibacterium sp. 050232]MED5812855.1 hypothetical protein [Mycolicibacterium sp. 050232]